MPAAPPTPYRRFITSHPRIGRAYEEMAEAILAEGPLDRRTAELVKIGIAVGARLEGATHAHVRKARQAGVSDEDIRHAVRLALTTVGFPTMMIASSWAEDVLSAGPARAAAPRARGAAPRPRAAKPRR